MSAWVDIIRRDLKDIIDASWEEAKKLATDTAEWRMASTCGPMHPQGRGLN